MKPLPTRNDVASVVGVGRSGWALISHLTERGVRVYAFDDKPREALGDLPARLAAMDVPLFASGEGELRGSFVFRSPSVRPDTPRLCRATLRGATVWGEAEYFAALCPCPIYGVTGSDGKTTTATMIASLLTASGRRTHLGGNIGRSLLPFLPDMRREDACVLELSSFQLMDFSVPVHTGVVTNLSPNHLNWHTDFAEYAAAKRRLVSLSHRAVLEEGLFEGVSALRFSARGEGNVTVKDGYITGFGVPLFSARHLKLRGEHNLKNLLAATAALGDVITPSMLLSFAQDFAGVPHRMERVGEKRGIHFINSSIDTTPTRTAATVAAMGEERFLLLLGGQGKHLPLAPLETAVKKAEKVYLFGEIGAEIAAFLDGLGLTYLACGSMEAAVLAAYAEASAGDNVLLSPAATAYDAYRDYEERGEVFRRIVQKLPE
ncbi:MAG: UDP-N-acetylmuramoyl-L-alanine--D-glutamate ligase [Clostridia bacterium]|nr:UDP-N-acetylmuramoyl-L-alanine--D-glutamate ligase [Clostridia bacterium]